MPWPYGNFAEFASGPQDLVDRDFSQNVSLQLGQRGRMGEGEVRLLAAWATYSVVLNALVFDRHSAPSFSHAVG